MFRTILLPPPPHTYFIPFYHSTNPSHWINGKMGLSLLICSVDAKYVVFWVSRFESSKLKPKALGCHSTIQYSLCYSIWYIVTYKRQFSSGKHSINCALKFAVPFSKTDSGKQKWLAQKTIMTQCRYFDMKIAKFKSLRLQHP